MKQPKTKREVNIDDFFGVEVEDPYRWLENYNDSEVQKWLNTQHKYLEAIKEEIPNYQESLERIKELLSIGFIGIPTIRGDLLFYRKSTVENQPILYVQKGFTGTPEELINPNKLSEESPVALDWYYISQSGKLIVYGLSENGDEWSILHIKNIETKEVLTERIPRTRSCSLCWLKDESGFYYTRYPIPGTVPNGQENYNRRVYFHKIGNDWKDDPLIFGEGRDPTNIYSVSISDDNRYLLVNVIKYTKNDLYLLDRQNKNKLKPIITGEDCLTSVTFDGDSLWLLSNRNHPNWVLYKTSIENPTTDNWEIIIPESEKVLQRVLVTEDALYAKLMQNAYDIIQKFDLNGNYQEDLDLPKYGSIQGLGVGAISKLKEEYFFFNQNTFLNPTITYQYNLKENNLAIFQKIDSPINPNDYQVEQVWYESKDKTKVSMFLAYKKDLKLDGSNPTMLCGYGGFNIAVKPPYLRDSRFYWLEKGGIIAIANLRGGSEYGEKWHRDGMLKNKQNVFDDFIYAAKWLIANNYTSSKHLGIYGRSNGGLLTGAALTQQPELFNAVYVGVPLLDMIRYHHFRIAKYWIPEYGSSESEEQFNFLIKYSPYHNVKKGTPYPATLLVAAASDSRVDPNHAMKMTAALQWANKTDEPIALYVETQAGHGVGKPLDKLALTETDIYVFLGWKTGLKM